MNMGNGRPSNQRWARVAVFGGGAVVLLLIGYGIGATLFPVTEPPATVAQVSPAADRTLVATFTPSPVAPTATTTVPPTNTPAPTATNPPAASPTPILIVVTAAPSPTPLPTHTAPPPTVTTPAINNGDDDDDPTATPTWTPTLIATPTWTPIFTPTWTPIPTSTWTATPTWTPTLIPTPTETATLAPTATSTATLIPTPTETATLAPTATSTATLIPTPTDTGTPTATTAPTETATATATMQPTATATATATATLLPTATATTPPTATATATLADTATATPTATAEATATKTPPPTETETVTPTETATPTETVTPVETATPTATSVPTAAWEFASSPSPVAYLNQSYTYTVTFAPVAAVEGDETEEPVEATPTATPADDEATATPEAEATPESTATPEATATETGEAGEEAATQEGDADATATPTPEESSTSLSFALTADGALTVEVPVRPTWLLLTVLDSGEVALTGVPLDGEEGEHVVAVIATDGAGVVITQSFTITAELDPNPFRMDELSFVTDEDTPLEAMLTAEHVEGAAPLFGIESEPANGAVTALDESSGAFTYAPLPDFTGEDSFVIHISDDRQREITAPVTITVNAINDAPRLELETTYTVTVGEEVALPVVVTDVEGDAITVTVDTLPPDLGYGDGAIAGIVAPDAAANSPYLTRVIASDSADAVTELEITWAVVSLLGGEENGGEDVTPPADAATPTPTEEESSNAATPTPMDEENGDTATPETEAAAPVTLTAANAARILPGADALAVYLWQPPLDFGDCPVVNGALTAAPLDASLSLLDDVVAEDPFNAPALGFDVELAAGDYALLVCGCAPAYADADRTSPPERNQALFAGIDGVAILADDGDPVALSGFAAQPGFTWQAQSAADGAPALFTIAEAGMRSIDLWMADDGLLVHAVGIAPASRFGEMLGQVCAGGE